MATEQTNDLYPINPFYAPEYPPIDRLRCRVDYEVHASAYDRPPQAWIGSEWWQYAEGDEARFGFAAEDLPRLFAVWTIFEAVVGMRHHFISGDTELIEKAMESMPWLNPNVIRTEDFARFAELMGIDGQKARGFFHKALSHDHDESSDKA